jgi:transposase
MAVAVGVDVAKEFHWAALVVAETGQVLSSQRVENTPGELAELITAIGAAEVGHGPATVGLDLLGGIASLAQAMLLDAGLHCVHVPGLAVNRARQGTTGGERKSDPKDAKVIADQVRTRDDLRPVTAMSEIDAELRLLVARRRELVADQVRRKGRVRDLLVSINPGLERAVDLSNKTGLWLLTRYVTPAEIRRAGPARVSAHLQKAGRIRKTVVQDLTEAAVAAAREQRTTVPGENTAADLIREMALEALQARDKLTALDERIGEVLDRHPDAALIASLPGMGAALTAELLAEAGGLDRFPTADRLAAAAGLAPILRQSGRARSTRRATGGNKALKRVFYQSAFCALNTDPASKAYYARKRAEGKRHHQALICLARRRVDVLHAVLRTRQPYRADIRTAA